jgi:tRNA dimethylallyltransferase
LAGLGPPALHARLDAATAARTDPHNGQRIARAYEVLIGTGRGLADWQAIPRAPLTGWRPFMVLLAPARDALAAAISTRFDAMLANGGLREVAALLALGLPPRLPLLRAPPAGRHLPASRRSGWKSPPPRAPRCNIPSGK